MARKPDTPCSACGKLLPSSKGSLPAGQRTCQPCRRGRRHELAKLRESARATSPCTRKARTCEVCSKTYDATYSAQRTCGRICGAEINPQSAASWPAEVNYNRRKRWPRTNIYVRDCAQCGCLFVGRNVRVLVCSDLCRLSRRSVYWARDKRRPSIDQAKRCACGTEIPRSRSKCEPCVELNRRESKRRRKRRARALKVGAKTEPYTLAEIAVRDRHRCGLCNRKVNMRLKVPHLKAPTIDHIVPMSISKDDTRANVQLAHFICNSTKCAGGGGEQLALVG